MSKNYELKEWENEPNFHVFEVTAPSWMRYKSHPKKRVDKKWRKRYGFEIREATVHCVVARVPEMKNLCGYVGLPKQHKHYRADGWAMDVDVHGGITFSNFWRGRTGFKRKYWYIGFDAGHYMDYVPGLEELFAKASPFELSINFFEMGAYRNMEYMTAETKLLAMQLLL